MIENVFPFLNVRFIAVTDNFDTNEGGGVENMVASFKNLVNDVYAKDISRKIITAFRTKQKNGEYIGLVAPYGYLKSAENKNKFVIDEKTAPAVKKIFELYAGGYGLDRIARIMNESDYDCPRKYRYSIGITKSDRYKNSKWGRTTINTILTNRAYIGDMVQGKVKQELCNNIVMHYTNKDDWIVVEGTHEAIIERNLFFEVQDILEKKKTEQAEAKARNEKKRAELEIRKARKKAKGEINDMKENMYVWSWGYIMIIVCSLVQNGAFQRDILQLGKKTIEWWLEYAEWFENLEYLGYSAGEVLFERSFTMILIILGIMGSVFLVWKATIQYKKIWDSMYKTVLILSVSFIAVLGNMIREVIPINLLVIVCFINIGTVWIRKYLENKYS